MVCVCPERLFFCCDFLTGVNLRYLHPNGQLPAYEWNFNDVNPPVHAWAALRVYQISKAVDGTTDTSFLARAFHKLLLNFTWWVNRKVRAQVFLWRRNASELIACRMRKGVTFSKAASWDWITLVSLIGRRRCHLANASTRYPLKQYCTKQQRSENFDSEQADGTAWMAKYCLNMLAVALELAVNDATYEDVATKFFEHFIYIANALNNSGLWNEEV